MTPLPAILGAAIVANVTVDDAGLSGAAAVRAGWAVAGQQEFTANVKPVPGQMLNDGRWSIVVPTDGLASGVHQMLIQPTDAAGNPGHVKAVSIAVRSEAELIAIEQSKSTAVSGKIAYVKRPVPGLNLALKKQPDEKPGEPAIKDGEGAPETTKSSLQVQTKDDGTFVFPAVTAGQYELSIDGMYRGMRHHKIIRVAVKPPQPSTLPTIRID